MNTPGERSPFAIRGAMEAFYGAFYTFPERKDLIRFLGRQGFNFFMYGPKNDRQHRVRWWDPYPKHVMDGFEETIAVAGAVGVEFCYAISFGSSAESMDLGVVAPVTSKLQGFYDRGCRSFAVLLDDIVIGFDRAPALDAYRAAGRGHVELANSLHAWVCNLPEPCSFYVCPGEYYGVAPFSEYLRAFGAGLEPGIDVFYCGPEVCSASITVQDVCGFAEAVGRLPVIWDNYPVNDLRMRPDLHLGPLRHRDPKLPDVCRGFVSNLMSQEEATKIPLLTIADYVRLPERYDPDVSWRRALRVMGRGDSVEPLTRLAENSLHSCLQKDQSPIMDRLARAALASLKAGEPVMQSDAVERLAGYFTELDEAGYYLKNRMRNLHLRDDLLPWIEALEDRIWMARRALSVLQAIESGVDYRPPLKTMKELRKAIDRKPEDIGGRSLFRLVDYVVERAAQQGVIGLSGNGAAGSRTVSLGDPAALNQGESGRDYVPESHPA